MKIKLIRKQKYTIETHQEIEIEVDESGKLDNIDYDAYFYNSKETIFNHDEETEFDHPDNFDYEGFDVLIQDPLSEEYIRLESYRNDFKDDLIDWSELPKTTIKEYIRNKKIDNILNK